MVIRCNSVVFELITMNYVAKQQITMNYGPQGQITRVAQITAKRITMNYGRPVHQSFSGGGRPYDHE